MEKEDLEERLKQEIETEARILERRVNTKKELASLKMPDDSYEQLMKQIREKEQSKTRSYSFSKKALAMAAMVVASITMVGMGVNGARLYVMNVERRGEDKEFQTAINTDETYFSEISENEIYEKIEDELGILALRIEDKPNGLELEEVFIDKEMGEALMEFGYKGHVLSIYESKQNKRASTNLQVDGKLVDKIETFYLEQEIGVLEFDKGNGEVFYQSQLEYSNAYYYLSSDMELEEFKSILYGIIFRTE